MSYIKRTINPRRISRLNWFPISFHMHFLPNQIIALDAFKNEKQINKKFCKEMTEVLAKKFNRSSVALDSDKLMEIFKRTHFTH